MFSEKCEVLENKNVAPGHFVLKFRSKKIAKAAKPGQFVQITCAEHSFDPLLARPFSFLETGGSEFSVLYHVVGKGTQLMEKLRKKDKVSVLGPLGNGFGLNPEPGARSPEKKILVGGGVGIPPLYHLAQVMIKNKTAKKENIHVLLGAQTKALLLCEKDFKKLGVNLFVATNDGSRGTKGFVTSLLTSILRAPGSGLRARIYTCGPTPMLKAVSHIAEEFLTPCEVAVEVPMACGFGACLGCAIKVKTTEPAGHRFAVACVEGPVFEGTKVLWD